MSKLDKDEVLAKFTEAYKAAHGKEPQVEAKSGWYSVDGGKNIRLAQIEEMTQALSGGSSETASAETAPAPKTEKKAAPKAEKKPAAKKKVSSGFSVKSYWNDKITGDNAGSILPR